MAASMYCMAITVICARMMGRLSFSAIWIYLVRGSSLFVLISSVGFILSIAI
ncbi:MAG: hypothetical protein II018_00455 [Firmicutes bacterium]|nr:hypothetical protein [Bacillota bacterium]